MNLKIKDNLFIVGTRVISYETEVAKINLKTGEIVTNGTYSRTTSKQLAYLSILTGLTLVKSKKRGRYFEFGFGTKCSTDGVQLSTTSAQTIVSKLGVARDIQLAAAFSWVELNPHDANLLQEKLRLSREELKQMGEDWLTLNQLQII